ncbi:class I SAM-dependent methyltransferase [Halostella sp. JP-L12]|uniref:class I SAM-dependent methyltransferase n=1 Tax=Halostella TaxID=1843185 RepID=UPI000EF7792E|nr:MULTISPECIES: class I SAM-dependent methyltransferase [Halostella]NHN48658.1 class I SAM-dependent methyltransferase [Halostella sp. JP-L12]
MDERNAVREGYDALAETYAGQRSDDETLGTTLLDDLLADLPDDGRLLDAGCGQGTPVLARADVEAVGLDFSPAQLRLASENAPGAALLRGDMGRLPFGADSFDAVTAFHSLIHVPLDDHQTVVDEFARVLRPGGRVLVSEGLTEWEGRNPDWLDSGAAMEWHIAGAEATREHLRTAGFDVLDQWAVDDTLADEEGAQKPFFLAALEK